MRREKSLIVNNIEKEISSLHTIKTFKSNVISHALLSDYVLILLGGSRKIYWKISSTRLCVRCCVKLKKNCVLQNHHFYCSIVKVGVENKNSRAHHMKKGLSFLRHCWADEEASKKIFTSESWSVQSFNFSCRMIKCVRWKRKTNSLEISILAMMKRQFGSFST